MECRTCFESLTAYIDGEVGASEQEEISLHLEACTGCQEQHESLTYAVALVGALPEPLLQPPSFGPVESRLPSGGSRFFDLWGFLLPRWVPAAALAALLMVLSVPFYWSTSSERQQLEREFATFLQERDRIEQEHVARRAQGGPDSLPPNPFSREVSFSQGNPFSSR